MENKEKGPHNVSVCSPFFLRLKFILMQEKPILYFYLPEGKITEFTATLTPTGKTNLVQTLHA